MQNYVTATLPSDTPTRTTGPIDGNGAFPITAGIPVGALTEPELCEYCGTREKRPASIPMVRAPDGTCVRCSDDPTWVLIIWYETACHRAIREAYRTAIEIHKL